MVFFTGELTDHLTSILEKQKIEVVKAKEQTAEEKARKEAILAQYGHVSSGERYCQLSRLKLAQY